ncbi:MAG TPA: transglycosylase SLT domain-containing protein [Rhodopila sp.]|jgi:soluble lytic murein transglycosylase-like protein|nr:transglycosylase SLT domain-containing protein [Rhodopila sp.]
MAWRRRLCVASLAVALPMLAGAGANADSTPTQTDDSLACDRAARQAENEFRLPPGLLAAIGSVESKLWPWAANIDGAAQTWRSKAEAVGALGRVRVKQPLDVDVGCFQVSLHYHPAAFATLDDALDPTANARYAARFLLQLHDKYGDWNHAVGAYHSATEPLEVDYRDRVMAQWKGAPLAAAPPPAEDQPRWKVISIAAALPPPLPPRALPRVITLGD